MTWRGRLPLPRETSSTMIARLGSALGPSVSGTSWFSPTNAATHLANATGAPTRSGLVRPRPHARASITSCAVPVDVMPALGGDDQARSGTSWARSWLQPRNIIPSSCHSASWKRVGERDAMGQHDSGICAGCIPSAPWRTWPVR